MHKPCGLTASNAKFQPKICKTFFGVTNKQANRETLFYVIEDNIFTYSQASIRMYHTSEETNYVTKVHAKIR